MSERYIVTLEPMPHAPPPIMRIKAALKLFGRRFAMRCVDIRQSDSPGSPAASETLAQTRQDARSGIGTDLEPSEGAKCGRIDADGSGIVGAGRQGSLHRGNQ